MAKAKRAPATEGVIDLDAFDKRKVDFTTFTPDLTSEQLKQILKPVRRIDLHTVLFLPIDVISPTKTVGQGRTNLTLVRPTVFQTDAATPYAGFDLAIGSAQQPPTVSVHFEPSAYGLPAPSRFVMSFSIEVDGSATFNVGAVAGVTVSGTGVRTVSGKQIVSVVFKNVPPTQQVYAHLSQTAGRTWRWFQTRISYPPLVISA
jgi:hypothetical protein